jgi:hypothetical protein
MVNERMSRPGNEKSAGCLALSKKIGEDREGKKKGQGQLDRNGRRAGRWHAPLANLLLGGSLLLDGQVNNGLGDGNEAETILFDVIRRPALVGDMLRDLERRNHIDGVPRAPLGTEVAADAALEVDIAKGLQTGMVFARDFVNAIHRTDFDAGFTTRAAIRPDYRQFLGKLFARFAGALCHDGSSFRVPLDAAIA